MTENNRGRSALPTNFWSFNFIDFKGLPLQFGSKTFTGFKIAEVQLSSFTMSNPEKVLPPIYSGKPLTSMKLNDQKLVGIADLSLLFPVILKMPFYYMAIYWGADTFVHICRTGSIS